ncbi:MAG TPA: hypothetical protein VN719_09130 [Gemmatimonadales bacterium]|jgi:hypothetical protein|nr:hypothetical protein [Gemmatimonadales bacterium]
MTYWPEDDETRTTGPSPFEDVFQDASEGWPVRDRYGLVTLKRGLKLLGEDFLELQRRDSAEAKRVLALADRLMQREGREKASKRPWLIVPDDPGDYREP